MTITNSSTRLAALVAGVAVAVALMASVAIAPAQAAGLSASQVQAIVSLLASFGADQGTINNVTAALNGQATTGSTSGSTSTGGACPVLTRSLQLGSSGADVMSLQKFLNANAATRVAVSGAGSPGMETTYFGPATQSAVIKFQAANSVSAIGVVGPATRAAIAAVCGTTGSTGGTTGGSTGSVTLQGGEGQIKNIDNTTADVESTVREGMTENVFGVEMDAKDSDIMVERVDVNFVQDDTESGSDKLGDYVQKVSLMLDGKTLATMDVDQATREDALGNSGDSDIFSDTANTGDNKYYSFRFSGLKGVIKEDDTARLYVAVKAVSTVDSTDANNNSWHVKIPTDGIRAVDGAGISDTYVSSSDLTDETFSVEGAQAGDIDLKANASDNEDRVISVSADNDTKGEEIMNFSLKSNTSDNNISDITISFATTSATSTLVQSAVKQVYLYQGSKQIASANVEGTLAGTETADFDNLDVNINEDDTEDFTVKADFYDNADRRDGFGFNVVVNGSDIDAEDAEGDNVTIGGSVTGGDLELRTTGITSTFKSADEVRTNGSIAGDADSVDFTIKFSVTAVGDDDIYLDGDTSNVASPTTGTNGLAWATSSDSTAFASTSATAILTADDGYTSDDSSASGAKYFKIDSGETRNFTLRVNLAAGTDGESLGVRITGLKWGTSSGSMGNLYTFDMTDFTTDTVTGLMIR